MTAGPVTPLHYLSGPVSWGRCAGTAEDEDESPSGASLSHQMLIGSSTVSLPTPAWHSSSTDSLNTVILHPTGTAHATSPKSWTPSTDIGMSYGKSPPVASAVEKQSTDRIIIPRRRRTERAQVRSMGTGSDYHRGCPS
jgi:hypothetical protein